MKRRKNEPGLCRPVLPSVLLVLAPADEGRMRRSLSRKFLGGEKSQPRVHSQDLPERRDLLFHHLTFLRGVSVQQQQVAFTEERSQAHHLLVPARPRHGLRQAQDTPPSLPACRSA